MAFEVISLVPEETRLRDEIRYKLENKMIDHQEYQGMTPDDQELVKEILRDIYAIPVTATEALSALEFGLFGLAKLFFQLVPAPDNLEPSAQEFYEKVKSIVEQHEVPIDPETWHLDYLLSTVMRVRQNRMEYKNEKERIIGEF